MTMKLKAVFICQQCGAQAVKWAGRCPSCGAWNAVVEEVVDDQPPRVQRMSEAVEPVTLVGGEPGIGKSTLLLSMAGRLSANGVRVLYVSGEESLHQTKLRAARLGLASSVMRLLACTQVEMILEAIRNTAAQVAVVDSIQVMESEALSSSPGSIGQVRACAQALVRLAKTSDRSEEHTSEL